MAQNHSTTTGTAEQGTLARAGPRDESLPPNVSFTTLLLQIITVPGMAYNEVLLPCM